MFPYRAISETDAKQSFGTPYVNTHVAIHMIAQILQKTYGRQLDKVFNVINLYLKLSGFFLALGYLYAKFESGI